MEVNIAGRLKTFVNQWYEITNDKFVLHAIQGYCIPLKQKVSQNKMPENCKMSETELYHLEIAVEKLLKSGAVELTGQCKDQFISPYFLVPKPDGSYRFILNLKKLNNFVISEHFKMEDLRTAVNILEHEDFMCTIDLRDAYFMIPVDINFRKYLCFIYKNQTFQFTCLPFGLSTCPYVYNKIMKPVLAKLRNKGIRLTNYLDDFLILGRTKEQTTMNTEVTKNLLISLGFVINFKKSELKPMKYCKYLGVMINSEKMLIELTETKKNNLKTTIEQILEQKFCNYGDLLSLIGTLVAACPAVKFGWLFYKELERIKCLQGPVGVCNSKKKIPMSELALKDLEWWSRTIRNASNNIRTSRFHKEIFSDASLSGWGAICNGKKAHGFWDLKERHYHINFLELLAAFLALKCFAKDDQDCQILLRIDNIVAISYINKLGGIKFQHLNEVTRSIWE